MDEVPTPAPTPTSVPVPAEVQPEKMSTSRKIVIVIVVALVIVAAAIVINTYFGDSIRKLFSNPIFSSGKNSTTANGTLSLKDLTGKCAVAGGTCSVSCSSASSSPTSGSVFSFSFLNRIADSVVSIFSPGESSANQAGVVGSVATMAELGSYPDYCTSELPKCCASAIGTLQATSIPVNTDPNSDSRLGCNNTCLQLGLSVGLCRISGSGNFSCANSDYFNQTGKKLTIPPFTDWCAPYAPNQTSGLSIACCCYK